MKFLVVVTPPSIYHKKIQKTKSPTSPMATTNGKNQTKNTPKLPTPTTNPSSKPHHGTLLAILPPQPPSTSNTTDPSKDRSASAGKRKVGARNTEANDEHIPVDPPAKILTHSDPLTISPARSAPPSSIDNTSNPVPTPPSMPPISNGRKNSDSSTERKKTSIPIMTKCPTLKGANDCKALLGSPLTFVEPPPPSTKY